MTFFKKKKETKRDVFVIEITCIYYNFTFNKKVCFETPITYEMLEDIVKNKLNVTRNEMEAINGNAQLLKKLFNEKKDILPNLRIGQSIEGKKEMDDYYLKISIEKTFCHKEE